MMKKAWSDLDDHKIAWVFVALLSVLLLLDAVRASDWLDAIISAGFVIVGVQRFMRLHRQEPYVAPVAVELPDEQEKDVLTIQMIRRMADRCNLKEWPISKRSLVDRPSINDMRMVATIDRDIYLIRFLRGCADAADKGELHVELGRLLVNGDLMREAAQEFENHVKRVME